MQDSSKTCPKECLNRHLRSRSTQLNASTTSLYEKLTFGTPRIQNAEVNESQSYEIAYYQKELLANRQFYMNQVKAKDEIIKELEFELVKMNAQHEKMNGKQKYIKTKSLHQQFQEVNMTPPPKPNTKRNSQEKNSNSKSNQKSTDFRLQLQRAKQEIKQEKDAQIRELKSKYDVEIRELYKTVKQLSNEKLDYLRYSKNYEQLKGQLNNTKKQLQLAKKNVIKRIEEINQKDHYIEELKLNYSNQSIEREIHKQNEQMKFLHAQNMEVKAILKDYENQLAQSNQQKKQLVLRYEEYVESLKKSYQQKNAQGNIQIKENFEEAIKYRELAEQVQKQNLRLRCEIQKVHQDYQTQINIMEAKERLIAEKYQKIAKEYKKKAEGLQINSFYISETFYESFLRIQQFKSFFTKDANGSPRKMMGELDLGRAIKNIAVRYQGLKEQLERVQSENVNISSKANELQQQVHLLHNKLQQNQNDHEKYQQQLIKQIEQLHLAIQQSDKENQILQNQDYEIQMLYSKISQMEKQVKRLQQDKLQTEKIVYGLTQVKQKLEDSLRICESKYEQIVTIKASHQKQLQKLMQEVQNKLKTQQQHKTILESQTQLIKEQNTTLKEQNDNFKAIMSKLELGLAYKDLQMQEKISKFESEKQQLINFVKDNLQYLISKKTQEIYMRVHQSTSGPLAAHEFRLKELVRQQEKLQNALKAVKRPIQLQIIQAMAQKNQKYNDLVDENFSLQVKMDKIKEANQSLRCESRVKGNYKVEELNSDGEQKQKLLNKIRQLERQKFEYQIMLEKSRERIREYIQMEKSYKNIFGHLKLQIQTHSQIFEQGSLEESSLSLYTGITALKDRKKSNEKEQIFGFSNAHRNSLLTEQQGLKPLFKQLRQGNHIEVYQRSSRKEKQKRTRHGYRDQPQESLIVKPQNKNSLNNALTQSKHEFSDLEKPEKIDQQGQNAKANQEANIQVINIQNMSFANPTNTKKESPIFNSLEQLFKIPGKECHSNVNSGCNSNNNSNSNKKDIEEDRSNQQFQQCCNSLLNSLYQQEEGQLHSIQQQNEFSELNQIMTAYRRVQILSEIQENNQEKQISLQEDSQKPKQSQIGQCKVETKQSEAQQQKAQNYMLQDYQQSIIEEKDQHEQSKAEQEESEKVQTPSKSKKKKKKRSKRRR